MNENFIKFLSESGLSKYSLAEKSGLPYTTICRLASQKMCINKISLEAAARLASVFEVGIEDVLDPFEYLEGATGYADKIKYKWIKDPENGMEILFTYKRRQIKDCIEKTLTNLRYRKIYEASAGMHIESFVEEQEFLEDVEKEIIGHGE